MKYSSHYLPFIYGGRRLKRSFLSLLLIVLLMGGGSIITLTLLTDLKMTEMLDDVLQPLWVLGPHNSSQANDIACYFDDATIDIENLNDYTIIEEINYDEVVRETSIFFHETSCHDSTVSSLFTSRQACAIESAAKMNPESQVYVLFPSPIHIKNMSVNNYLSKLRMYKNVNIKHINMGRYLRDTPLEDWYKSGWLFTSKWPRSHASDLLRYVTLWKYGGVYLDLDVVVVKSLQGLTNFSGAESDTAVAAGVMGFSHNGSGHEMATDCLADLKKNFRGYDWGNNGPGVITRVLKETCKVSTVGDMTPERCKGFRVYPPSWFYPVSWKQWQLYFTENKTESHAVINDLEKSHVIHVWNKFSADTVVRIGSIQPYGLIASKYCPSVYYSGESIF